MSTLSDPALVSIIIPHYNGSAMLSKCLESLQKTTYPNFKIILADNASEDNSVQMVSEDFPSVDVIRLDSNKGYAGGCNAGIVAAKKSDYVVLLNNDVLVDPEWLTIMVDVMESDNNIAACQPKILSLKNKGYFDYSGAAGGLMDKYAYPFARGRIIATIEQDNGQYNDETSIFWASGTACILRNSALEKVGYLDEVFFAHMEEIDLCWRFRLSGYKIMVAPKSVIYHQSGATLSAEKFKKKYLNHRNSIIMMLKNYSSWSLIKLFPMRIILETMALGYSLLTLDLNRFSGLIAAFLWLLTHPIYLIRARKRAQSVRVISDEEILNSLYDGSIALSYYFKGKKTAKELE